MKLIKILTFLIFFSFINIKKNDSKIEVIKFMGTFQTYPTDVNYRIFWGYPEEHAKLNIIYDFDLKEKFNKLPLIKENINFEFLTYAFIYKNGIKKDTIYADQTLKAFKKFKHVKGSKYKDEIYFYDEKGEIAEILRWKFSFFRDCW